MNGTLNGTQLDNATLAMFKDNTTSYVVAAVYIIIFLINVPGNSISLWLLLFRTFPKTPSIIFMINLTLTDLAVGSALPFQIIYQLNGYNWTCGPTMCSFMTVLFYANMYCSILTMTAISVDRYLGIVQPIHFKVMRGRKECAVIGCIFMWAIVLSALFPLEGTDLTYEVKDLNITTCFDVLKKDMLPDITHWAIFLFTLSFVLFLVPFIVTVICYVSIIRELVRTSKSHQKGTALRLAFIVLFVFIICFAPNNIILIAHAVRRLFYNKSLYMAYKLSLSLSCVNSCLDPFIYYFASKEFRRKLRRMLNLRSTSSTEVHETEHRRDSMFSAQSANSPTEAEDARAPISTNNESNL
ncbi:P2Y purinoceptor 8-like [Megalops cyprinoides]|uniref:P2Y purinoceptor 8-like n=1 Tax=Megalops cyprinoides TaxID=118141 RepID=UPI00186549B6|nr:P2Y purinoceptor 8-like [Megalops cyprinoides]XP_036397115.1 P2Y purinoceptor 8-like [Megalops cyprinoides]